MLPLELFWFEVSFYPEPDELEYVFPELLPEFGDTEAEYM